MTSTASHQLQLQELSSQIQQCDSLPALTYRQKRRIAQALKNGPKRGPTTGKKYRLEKEKNPGAKTKIDFSEELRRVVGKNVDQFICDLGRWVKEFCPLDSKNWTRMDGAAKERLLNEIKGKYDLPPTLRGKPIDAALQFQCAALYRGWRYRLKERYFVRHSRKQSRANKPPEVERKKWYWLVDFWMDSKTESVSTKNRGNRLSQTVTPANGAKSTARILHDMLNALPPAEKESQVEGSTFSILEAEEEPEPVYIKLYEKTKRHKDGTWDADAEANYSALKKRHRDEIEMHGVDNLTVQEAYSDVLETRPGYIRGLGPGSQPPKKDKSCETSRLTTKIQELQERQEASAEREAELEGVINDLKSSNEELRAMMERIQHEALEREEKMRQEFLKMIRPKRKR